MMNENTAPMMEHTDELFGDYVEIKTEAEPENYEMGKVVNCKKLNIRVAPDKTAAVVKEVEKGVELMIDPSDSTDDFYKVCTESGVEGYCMKLFVAVK